MSCLHSLQFLLNGVLQEIGFYIDPCRDDRICYFDIYFIISITGSIPLLVYKSPRISFVH